MAPRRLLVLLGTPDQTRAEAARRLSAFRDVVWDEAPLGTSAEAVVVDLHAGFDPDALGRAHGLVRGGGVLALRMAPDGPPPSPSLVVWPHTLAQVRPHLRDRLRRSLEGVVDPGELAPVPFVTVGSPDQRRVVEALQASAPGTRHVVLGARGRGKSAALGLGVAALPGRAVVTALESAHADEVRRFAPDVPFRAVEDLLAGDGTYDTVIVDEASCLPVPLLSALAHRHAAARLVFATTVQGYEGTGRGFVHRFLPRLRAEGPVTEHRLVVPIRWAEGDPLEAWIDRLLLFDVVRAPVHGTEGLRTARLEPQRLAEDEALLRDVFGLLVEAHYRTTPSDLARLLDAPNLTVHAAMSGGRAVGVAWVAEEGGLPDAIVSAIRRGERVRGHALAETLVSHAGADDGGRLRWVRSVRLATDPDRRRQGIAGRLVEHVEHAHAPDGFGTMFGATAELVRFRTGLGYLPVRLASARGARSGEPSVVMIKPLSPRARVLVAGLRAALARDLSAQLALCAVDGGLPVDPALEALLAADLPAPAALDPEGVAAFLRGRPYEAAVTAVEARVAGADLSVLPAELRALVEGRVLQRRSWRSLATSPHHPGVPATMRALRRAIALLVGQSAPM